MTWKGHTGIKTRERNIGNRYPSKLWTEAIRKFQRIQNGASKYTIICTMFSYFCFIFLISLTDWSHLVLHLLKRGVEQSSLKMLCSKMTPNHLSYKLWKTNKCIFIQCFFKIFDDKWLFLSILSVETCIIYMFFILRLAEMFWSIMITAFFIGICSGTLKGMFLFVE